MISSEVQRTLVKSPPELWAELSDPAALARHLGELGEIRITRVEPEQLVEWEAGNRIGTVRIKPSGWGTKVTLTVASEVPEADTSTSPAVTEPAAFAGDEPTAVAEDPAALAEDEPAAFAGDEPTALAEDPAALAEDEPAAFAEGEPAAPEDSTPSPLGLPLTAAAASSWRTDTEPAEPEDRDDSPGWIAEEADELPADEADREDEGEAYEWLAYEEPEPRRGFFARLLGRWRRPEDVEGSEAEEPPEAESPAGEPPEPEPSAGESVPQSPGPALEGPLEPEADADPALHAGTAPQIPVDAPPPDAPPADDVEPAHAAPAAEGAAAKPEAFSPQPAPGGQGEDIAAELKAAEESEDAEMTAVLTSVLDRLGAAHHRPFSRS